MWIYFQLENHVCMEYADSTSAALKIWPANSKTWGFNVWESRTLKPHWTNERGSSWILSTLVSITAGVALIWTRLGWPFKSSCKSLDKMAKWPVFQCLISKSLKPSWIGRVLVIWKLKTTVTTALHLRVSLFHCIQQDPREIAYKGFIWCSSPTCQAEQKTLLLSWCI